MRSRFMKKSETHAAQCGIDVCICVGALSVHMAEAARKADQEFKVNL
mgnify:CR=1 FL=1